jgi:hypothetical protein
MPLPLHINLCHEQDITDWLLRHIARYPHYKGEILQENEMLD